MRGRKDALWGKAVETAVKSNAERKVAAQMAAKTSQNRRGFFSDFGGVASSTTVGSVVDWVEVEGKRGGDWGGVSRDFSFKCEERVEAGEDILAVIEGGESAGEEREQERRAKRRL
jgi:hypothetical protein